MTCTNPSCGKEFEPDYPRKRGRPTDTCSPECRREKQLWRLRNYHKGITIKERREDFDRKKDDKIRDRLDVEGNNFNCRYF